MDNKTVLEFTKINECLALINQRLETIEADGKLILQIVTNINRKLEGEK